MLARVALATVVLTACPFDRQSQRPVNVAPPPVAAQPAPAPTQVRNAPIISAPYSSTLLWAIDGAAGVVGHDVSYKKWLTGDAADPAWLTAYRAVRSPLRHDPIVACTVTTAIVEEALKCVRESGGEAEAKALAEATRAIDEQMRARWQILSPVLQKLTRSLEALLTSDVEWQLFEQLRRMTAREPGSPFELRIILVGKIEGPTTLSLATDDTLLIETNLAQEGSPPDVPTLLARISEWAARKAIGRDGLEGAFRGKGYEGVMLAAAWPEIIGGGFGKGLGGSITNPRFCFEQPFAERRMVDALAHELYLEWRTGAAFVVGASFADHLLQLMRRVWAKDKWTLRDLLGGVQVTSDDADAAKAFLQALGAERTTPRAVTPPGASLARPKAVSALAPRVLLATEETLRVRTDLLGELQIQAADVSARLRSTNAAAYWGDDASGVPFVLVVARDRADLRRAAKDFAGRPSVPQAGWMTINFVMAKR